MTASDEHPRKPVSGDPRRAVRRIAVTLALTLLVIILACTGIWLLADKYSYRAQFEEALAELSARGVPVTLAELDDSRPKIPDDENAALIYKQAFEILGDTRNVRNEGKVPILSMTHEPEDPTEPYPAGMLEASRAFLAEKSEVLALLREASRRGASDYGVTGKGYDTPLPHLAKSRRCTRFLALASHVAAEDGDYEEAVRTVHDSLAITRSLCGESGTVSASVAHGCGSITAGGLTRTLARAAPSDEALAALQKDFESTAQAISPEPGIGGEIALFAEVCAQTASGKGVVWEKLGEDGERASPFAFLGIRAVFRREVVLAAPLLIELYETSQNPTPERLRLAASDHYKERAPKNSFLAYSVVSSVARTVVDTELTRAKLLAAAAGIAALRFERANGRPPESLEALVPDFLAAAPIDPMTGDPLIFRETDKGLLIYTVGRNSRDDGGYGFLLPTGETAAGGRPQEEPDDNGFRLARPRKAENGE